LLVINGKTSLYGIIGNPVGHSLSPVMHNAAFAAMSINGVYVPMPIDNVAKAISGLSSLGFIGISVTVPHKETVMKYLDEIDPVALKIGAVNTLLFRRHPETGIVVSRGFNTDWLGSNLALAEKIKLPGSRVLILGAGGAAKAIGFGLVEAGAEVVVCNRSEDRGRQLADWLSCRFCSRDELAGVRADCLVNTTSVGMEPDSDAIPLAPELLADFQLVMDIVYAPLQTTLLKEAATAGCMTVDGLSMLLYQGAVQFKIWTGRQPPLDVMRSALLAELDRRAE
jgi:shikimate dehydrogenase